MTKKGWVTVLLITVVLATLAVSGCNGATTPTLPPGDHLVLTMSFDDDPNGYPQDSQVDVYILEDERFRLEDRYGTFTGREAGYDDGGSYQWE